MSLRRPFFVLLCIVSSGCNDSWGSVHGTATLDGVPLDKGEVVFTPVGGGPAAYGSIRPNGQFSLATGDGVGLKPGEYVAVVCVQSIPADGSGEPAKFLTPAKYATPATSGLNVTIVPGRNSVTLKLTSN